MKAHRVESAEGGTRTRVAPGRTAVVVGGGLAGVAAATILAERGVAVTIVEREAYLGGRVGAWTDHLADGTPFEMERGFHAFFRQYYNLRSLLRRVDPTLSSLEQLTDYPLYGPDGAPESFSGLPKTTPLNIIELVRRTPRLGLTDLMKVNVKAATEMLAYDPERTYALFDSVTAREYLDSLRFPSDARHMLFDVFAHSFFNPEELMSAGDLLMMFHFYFTGNAEGLVFDVLKEPFSVALWQPLRRYLSGLGVEFKLETRAESVAPTADGGFELTVARNDEQETLSADGVVLAVEVPALRALVAASPGLDDLPFRDAIDSLGVTYPFAVWRLWVDCPANPDRQPFVGTSGLGILDNISLFERFEGESRRWAMQTGGSVVELHAYAVPPSMSEEEIKKDLWHQLLRVYPEFADAKVLDERYLLRQDCPSFYTGDHPRRPGVVSGIRGLALAGDFVRTKFPSALMERATATGMMAANHLLSRWDGAPEPIWSVAPRGIVAPLFGRKA